MFLIRHITVTSMLPLFLGPFYPLLKQLLRQQIDWKPKIARRTVTVTGASLMHCARPLQKKLPSEKQPIPDTP